MKRAAVTILLAVSAFAQAAPPPVSPTPASSPGVSREWEAPPSALEFAEVAGDEGYVVAVSHARWQYILERLDAAETAALKCALARDALKKELDACSAQVEDDTGVISLQRAELLACQLELARKGGMWKMFLAGAGAGVLADRMVD